MACSPEGSRVSGAAFVTIAYINRIGSAVPEHDVHQTFIRFVDQFLPDRKAKLLMKRMAQRAEIEHRYSTLEPNEECEIAADRNGFYRAGEFAGTAARPAAFETHAVALAGRAIEPLDTDGER